LVGGRWANVYWVVGKIANNAVREMAISKAALRAAGFSGYLQALIV